MESVFCFYFNKIYIFFQISFTRFLKTKIINLVASDSFRVKFSSTARLTGGIIIIRRRRILLCITYGTWQFYYSNICSIKIEICTISISTTLWTRSRSLYFVIVRLAPLKILEICRMSFLDETELQSSISFN